MADPKSIKRSKGLRSCTRWEEDCDRMPLGQRVVMVYESAMELYLAVGDDVRRLE